MITPEKQRDWNELEFLSWTEFTQMAPAIVSLEVRRIDRLLRHVDELDRHNRLVKARFEMKQFIQAVTAAQPGAAAACASHLRNALLNVAFENSPQNAELAQACAAITARLNDMLRRIELLY